MPTPRASSFAPAALPRTPLTVRRLPSATSTPSTTVATTTSAPATTTSMQKAHMLKRVETSGSGSTFAIRIAGDGALSYKAFRLENPSRLVIDLNGVKNGVIKAPANVDDPIVKKVRVAQFQTTPQMIARVVLDLASRANYKINEDGDHLTV